jgi:putative nucleotidyltransferase with HDIG domain
MTEDALAGTHVLIMVGADRAAAAALRAQLTGAGCPSVALAADHDAAVAKALAERPDAIVALEGAVALRARLDPFGLDDAPPVIAFGDLGGLDDRVPDRLGLLIEHRALRARVRELESVVASQALAGHRDVDSLRADTLRRLALAAEYRDDNTPEHTERVGALAARLASGLGLPDLEVGLVRRGAPLHDLGKIAIPDSILLKPGKLEPEEYEVVKTHAVLGARVLENGSSPLLDTAAQIARSHHERWDGGGYPDGFAGADIPLAGRLVHVADVFDVLVHERPYRESFTWEQAAAEIRAGSGTQFDPEVVRAFEALGPSGWSTD